MKKNPKHYLILILIIFFLVSSFNAVACGCKGATQNFVCGQNITESCSLDCDLNSNGRCFTIQANNIIIDGKGHSITGNSSIGGDALFAEANKNIKNVIIKNFKIYNFMQDGINFEKTQNISIINNTIKNTNNGILLVSSSKNIIKNNIFIENKKGIYIPYSSNNKITNNTVINNSYDGISLESSKNNTITYNKCLGSEYGAFLYLSNNNKILYNVFNYNNKRVQNDSDGIMLSGSSNNTLINNTMNGNDGDGIEFYNSSSNNISNNKVEFNDGVGVRINAYSSKNNIINNSVNKNRNGIIIERYSTNCNLINNTANSNMERGIFLYNYSSNNILLNNRADKNNWTGIHVYLYSNNNKITGNIANSNNMSGLWLDISATGNKINSNKFCDNNKIKSKYYDIYDQGISNSGDNNMCNLTKGWNDVSSTAGCKKSCIAVTPPPDISIKWWETKSGGKVPPWTSEDIWIDNTAKNPADSKPNNFLTKNDPIIINKTNRIYARFKNNGPTISHNISAEFYIAASVAAMHFDPNKDRDSSDMIGNFKIINASVKPANISKDKNSDGKIDELKPQEEAIVYAEWTPVSGPQHRCIAVKIKNDDKEIVINNNIAQENLMIKNVSKPSFPSPESPFQIPLSFKVFNPFPEKATILELKIESQIHYGWEVVIEPNIINMQRNEDYADIEVMVNIPQENTANTGIISVSSHIPGEEKTYGGFSAIIEIKEQSRTEFWIIVLLIFIALLTIIVLIKKKKERV